MTTPKGTRVQKSPAQLMLDWQDDEVRRALAWAQANIPGMLNQQRRDDYEAGIRQGWRKAVATIKLHGFSADQLKTAA